MLTREDDVDAHALHAKGWKISAIARHLGHDRKTIRSYLFGGRVAGVRAKASVDEFDRFAGYVGERLREDPHLWATTLFDELTDLGFEQSYPTLTRQIRARALRPHCEPCRPAKGRPVAVIDHPPGEETQWDWVELHDPPAAWGWGRSACLFVGAFSHSGKWRGRLAESMDQPHVIEGLDRVARDLGGLTSATPPRDGSPHRSRGSRSTTGSTWRSAHRGTGTARASWRRPTTPPRNAGGGPCPTTPRSKRRRRRSIVSASNGSMVG